MSKYKDYFNEMFELHREQFLAFMVLNQDYAKDRTGLSEEFNRRGKEIKEIISEWDRRLCAKMERGRNGQYSTTVSEKFWDEVRKYFPCIDEVGVTVKRLKG